MPTRESCLLGFSYYLLTSAVVFSGVWLGSDFFRPRNTIGDPVDSPLANWDGVWYTKIARHGYFYDPDRQSPIAFFPIYPCAGFLVSRLFKIREEYALIAVSQLSLVSLFVALAAYVQSQNEAGRSEVTDWTLVAFGVWPTTFFFRMAYSESTFVLFVVLVFLGMQRKWPAWGIAAIVGLATGSRFVGVALLPVFALHLWQNSKTKHEFAWRCLVLVPLASWGLLAFMAYQHWAFGNATAFVDTQEQWVSDSSSWAERIIAGIILGPIWGKYDPSHNSYWAHNEAIDNPLFSLDFANPIFFLATLGLLVVGARRSWLNSRELLFGLLVLMICYFSHGQRAAMLAQGRYAASVFPVYLVAGRLLSTCSAPLAATWVGFSTFLLGVYAALFASWYRLF